MAEDRLPEMDLSIPELAEHERMAAASTRLAAASSVREIPNEYRLQLSAMGIALQLAAEEHERYPCGRRGCGAAALADVLLGRPVGRG